MFVNSLGNRINQYLNIKNILWCISLVALFALEVILIIGIIGWIMLLIGESSKITSIMVITKWVFLITVPIVLLFKLISFIIHPEYGGGRNRIGTGGLGHNDREENDN